MTSRPHGEPFITPRQKLVNGRGLDHCWVSIALRLDQSAAFRTLYGSFSAGIYDGKVSSDFVPPLLYGRKFTPKLLPWERISTREQVNERQQAIRIPDEVI